METGLRFVYDENWYRFFGSALRKMYDEYMTEEHFVFYILRRIFRNQFFKKERSSGT